MVVEVRFLFGGYVGFTVYPFIFIRKGHRQNLVLINHERIHLHQQRELTPLLFFIVYFVSYIYNMLSYMNHNKAYRNIIFEREAYQNEKNLEYLRG